VLRLWEADEPGVADGPVAAPSAAPAEPTALRSRSSPGATTGATASPAAANAERFDTSGAEGACSVGPAAGLGPRAAGIGPALASTLLAAAAARRARRCGS
jgi:hypothetical protein